MAEILRERAWFIAIAAIVVAALAAVPAFTSGYIISLFLFLFANVAMATAWSFFSGPTRYISLATAAFIGIGIYTVIFLIDRVPLMLALAAAPVMGFLVALVVGLSTLRLRGVYFVIFTFGLTELIKQLVIWYEVHANKTLLRFVFTDVTPTFLYELLLAIAVFTILACWLAGYTRLGFALRSIGEDETVARHTGINTTKVKIVVFALSASIISLTGAVLSLRYTYLDPNVAFNSVWSFQVLIMALLGGVGRAWGPALGAIPLVLLSDYLAGSLPHHFGIALGLCFVLIVYFVPGGIAPRVEHLWQTLRSSRAKTEQA